MSDKVYEEYCNKHPEEITSDFLLEEDGNEDYIDEIEESLAYDDYLVQADRDRKAEEHGLQEDS